MVKEFPSIVSEFPSAPVDSYIPGVTVTYHHGNCLLQLATRERKGSHCMTGCS